MAELPLTVAETQKSSLPIRATSRTLELATTVHLALAMRRPLFLEGEPGTGKTEIAKVLAAGLGRRLVHGCNATTAWMPFGRSLRVGPCAAAHGNSPGGGGGLPDRTLGELASDIYTRKYLLVPATTLLRIGAVDLDATTPAVLLIDELDRADEPFEAFLLELLAGFSRSPCPNSAAMRAKNHAGGGDHVEPHARGP